VLDEDRKGDRGVNWLQVSRVFNPCLSFLSPFLNLQTDFELFLRSLRHVVPSLARDLALCLRSMEMKPVLLARFLPLLRPCVKTLFPLSLSSAYFLHHRRTGYRYRCGMGVLEIVRRAAVGKRSKEREGKGQLRF